MNLCPNNALRPKRRANPIGLPTFFDSITEQFYQVDFSLRIEHGAIAGPLHDIDRTLAVGTIDVAFAATGNRFPVRRVINPVPVTTIVLLLPIAGIRNRRDVLPVFSSMLSESFPAFLKPSGKELGMKKSRYTEESFTLRQAETGTRSGQAIDSGSPPSSGDPS